MTSPSFLTKSDEALLLRIARDTLESYLRSKVKPSLEDYPLNDALRSHHGAFVTIHHNGALRGCIGHTRNDCPLADTVQRHTISAALHDPRFPRMTAAELPGSHIEISALAEGDEPGSPFRRISGPDDIHIGSDGLFIRRTQERGGILLPQVASERGWNAEQFLEATCTKAGYSPRAWTRPDAESYFFRAQVFGEPEA